MMIPTIPASLDFPDREKPYVESIDGRLEPKVSPKTRHSLLQGRLVRAIDEWGRGRGYTGPEWRFYLLEEGARPSSLVPDVAFVAKERLDRSLPEDARERPRLAPDIAVEILSPGDRRTTLQRKIALYLQHGSKVVVVLDPEERKIELHSRHGVVRSAAFGSLAIAPYDDLSIDCDELFRDL